MFNDELFDLGQLVPAEAAIARETDLFQPILRISPGVGNMYVRRLAILQAIEKESIATDS
jgi:hypothetical protein